jgi:putative heme iron utilization protein
MATDATALQPSATVLDSIWESIITPGASTGLIATVNAVLLLQLMIFGSLLVTGWYNIHIVVMMVLSAIMLGLFNW